MTDGTFGMDEDSDGECTCGECAVCCETEYIPPGVQYTRDFPFWGYE